MLQVTVFSSVANASFATRKYRLPSITEGILVSYVNIFFAIKVGNTDYFIRSEQHGGWVGGEGDHQLFIPSIIV